MKSSYRSNEVSVFVWIIMYLLSVLFGWINYRYHLSKVELYQYSFLFVDIWIAKGINLIALLVNIFLIKRIFTNRDRGISGIYPMFVYLLVNNKWWVFDNINNYLISDFFVLIALYLINPQKVKKKINLLVFYLAVFFGTGFLMGINFIYSFIIPVFIFNLFLLSDWKSWVIFILGFLLPIYFYVMVSWLTNHDPFLFLKILIDHTSYKLGQFSLKDFSLTGEMQWANTGIIIIVALVFISGLQELKDVGFYATRERTIALFFFFLMFFSLLNYFLLYFFYHKHAFSVIALPYAYYVGGLLNKTTQNTRGFILFLLFILTVFL